MFETPLKEAGAASALSVEERAVPGLRGLFLTAERAAEMIGEGGDPAERQGRGVAEIITPAWTGRLKRDRHASADL